MKQLIGCTTLWTWMMIDCCRKSLRHTFESIFKTGRVFNYDICLHIGNRPVGPFKMKLGPTNGGNLRNATLPIKWSKDWIMWTYAKLHTPCFPAFVGATDVVSSINLVAFLLVYHKQGLYTRNRAKTVRTLLCQFKGQVIVCKTRCDTDFWWQKLIFGWCVGV